MSRAESRDRASGVVTDNVRIDIDGRPRTAVEVAPATAAAGGPERLVLAVHGSGQNPARFRAATARSMEAMAADGSSVVVYPASWRGGLWNDARAGTPSKAREEGVDDVKFLRELVDRHRARGVRRVVAVGYSNGGQMLLRVRRDAPGMLDAAALVGATLPAENNMLPAGSPWHVESAVPAVLVHGTRDRIVPFAGGVASLLGFQPRGLMRSFDETVAAFIDEAQLDGSSSSAVLPRRHSSGTSTTQTIYTTPDRPPVITYVVAGGGHTYPGQRRRLPSLIGRTSPDVDLTRVLRVIDDPQSIEALRIH